MNPTLSIITVNFNSSDFIGVMLYALKKLTYYHYEVYIADNGSSEKELLRLIQIVKKYDNVSLTLREQSQIGSIGHGEALEILFSKVITPYVAVLDADATFLHKHWDKILIENLNNKFKAIGTVLHNGSHRKPLDFPLMFATLYETKVLKDLNISFKPGKNPKNQIEDTGFQIREKFHNAGLKGNVFDTRNTRWYREGPLKNVICAEYYLDGYNHIFATHFGRGSTLGKNKYTKWGKWLRKIPFLNDLYIYKLGEKEKRDWINTCYKLIDNQIA